MTMPGVEQRIAMPMMASSKPSASSASSLKALAQSRMSARSELLTFEPSDLLVQVLDALGPHDVADGDQIAAALAVEHLRAGDLLGAVAAIDAIEAQAVEHVGARH